MNNLKEIGAVLFLGAGASKPLGIPLMRDFWQIVYNGVELNRAKEALGKIKDVYEKESGHSGYPDLEAILELMERYRNYYEIMFEDPIFGWDVYNKDMEKYWLFPSQEPKRKDYIQTHIKNDMELREGVYRAMSYLHSAIFQLFWPKLDSTEVSNLYNPLFEVLADAFRQSSIPVFTTNYDPAIETYGENDGVFIEMGFESKSGRLFWSPLRFHNLVTQPDKKNIVFFKLHGSMSWRREGDKIINYGLSLRGGPGVPALVYPTQTKEYPNEEPFKTAYNYFQVCLSKARFIVAIVTLPRY